jgi:hypothetical protein
VEPCRFGICGDSTLSGSFWNFVYPNWYQQYEGEKTLRNESEINYPNSPSPFMERGLGG